MTQSGAPSLQALVEPVVSGLGYELVGVEHRPDSRHGLVRVFIDSLDGITLDDCQRVSDQLSGVLDVEDPIPGGYVLEVSSPGLDRPLFSPAHFERFLGHEARVKLRTKLDGRKRFTGRIGRVEGAAVVLEVDGEEVTLPLDEVDRANLVPEY